jgi:hypothetical protein
VSFVPLQGIAVEQQQQQLQPINATDMSPPSTVQRLVHWVLLNTAVRDQLEAVLGGRINHSTGPFRVLQKDDYPSQLCAMNALQHCGLTPDKGVWCPTGKVMSVTHQVEVRDSVGQVVCSLYVNDHISTEASIQADLRLWGVHDMTVSWNERRREWQIEAQANKRPRLTAEEKEEQQQEEAMQVGEHQWGTIPLAILENSSLAALRH